MGGYIFKRAVIVGFLALLFSQAVYAQTSNQPAAQSTAIPVYDLGIREQGRNYPLKLTAQNVNCDTAQDFEFEIDSTPWLYAPKGARIPGLGPGQGRSIKARLDFTYTPPGIYYGRVTSRCTSCGWYIFAACVENGQDIVLKVTIVDPGDDQQGAGLPQTPNPYADLQPRQDSRIFLDPPISREDEDLLTRKNRRFLRELRGNVKAAQANGEKARDALRKARVKKNNCERELAKLKAALDAANRKHGIAKQDAANAASAANAAEKKLAEYDADVKKAEDVADRTRRYVETAKFALDHHSRTFGRGSKQYKASKKLLQKNQTEKRAADKALKKIKTSKADRQAAAKEARRTADAAKANEKRAQDAAKAAKANYDAKARECKGLAAAKKDAEKKLDEAEKRAEGAVDVANYEEGESKKRADKIKADIRAQRELKLEERLKLKRKHCLKLEKEVRDEMRQMTAALNALKKNGYFRSKENAAKNPPTPTSIFNQYVELGTNTAANVAGAVSSVPGSLPLPGTPAGTDIALGVMQAAYGIAVIRQSELIPGRAGHGRSEGKELRDWLRDNNFAHTDPDGSDARAVEDEMRRIIANRNYMAEQIRRGLEALERCKLDIAGMEAKLIEEVRARKKK